jgi:hypothetical protein
MAASTSRAALETRCTIVRNATSTSVLCVCPWQTRTTVVSLWWSSQYTAPWQMTTSLGSMSVYVARSPFNFAKHLNEPHTSDLEEKTLGQVVSSQRSCVVSMVSIHTLADSPLRPPSDGNHRSMWSEHTWCTTTHRTPYPIWQRGGICSFWLADCTGRDRQIVHYAPT